MANPKPILNPARPWTNPKILLYHGTVESRAASIIVGPIRVALGRPLTDFGSGFYTTTNVRQAHSWAAQIAATMTPEKLAVVEISIEREELAKLDTLAFVRGDHDAEDYWSFVHHCRLGETGHVRGAVSSVFYDCVYGPVSAFWNQRLLIDTADQISFHTAAADIVLNNSKRKRIL